MGAPAWMRDVRFLTFDVNEDTPPFVPDDEGCVINTPYGTLDIEPEVYNAEAERFVRTGAKICPILRGFEDEVYDGKCYAMHEKCWFDFEKVAERVYGTPQGEMDSEKLKILVGIFESGRVVKQGDYRLGFPHGYGNEVEIERYWDQIRIHGVRALGPVSLLDHHRFLEKQPLNDFWRFGRPFKGPDRRVLQNTLYSIDVLRKELERAGMEDTTVALREDGYWVPAITGLPVEIMIRILEFVGGDGIIKFGIIEDAKGRVRVPEGVWEREFRVRGEAGWADGDGYWKARDDLSWFERFVSVRARIKLDETKIESLRNWKRIFRVCEEILDVIFDACNGRVEGVEEGESGVRNRGFKVVVPKSRGGVEKYLKLGSLKATGVMVSYTGSGKMKFVSGMRFLPGGEGIGIVNLEDEVYCELFSKVPGGTVVLRARFGEFGVTNIMTTNGEEECLKVDGDLNEREGVSEVKFIAGPDGVDIGGVSVSIDPYKITALGIDCKAFVS
ncbi:uncharacterized protein DFL_005171 [Arthrobotrys flagrans]|uniref:Uncharacterized protein n=1 Tax=Arthrobotrys flagrans TaxID=97331 RepID=A0A437A7I5_ARTFL|nr:hypothetical protein DFL_005171 [Arthrobotrys flagrans]